MKNIHSKLVCASALVLSFAMVAGTAEARKRVKHDWNINPAAYAPDGLGDYGTEPVKQKQKVAKVTKKQPSRKAQRIARKGRFDWHKNPGAYAPDALTDYGVIAVRKLEEHRPVAVTIEPKRSAGRHDWQVNPSAYAPDALTAYGVVDLQRKTAPNA